MRFTTKSRWEFTSTWCWCGWSCWAMPRWAASSIFLVMPAVFGSYLKAGRPQLKSCCFQWERLQTEKQRLDSTNYDAFTAALSEPKWEKLKTVKNFDRIHKQTSVIGGRAPAAKTAASPHCNYAHSNSLYLHAGSDPGRGGSIIQTLLHQRH